MSFLSFLSFKKSLKIIPFLFYDDIDTIFKKSPFLCYNILMICYEIKLIYF